MRAIKLSRDVRPVSDLKTHGGEILRQVVDSRQPVVFSRHGRAAAVLVPVDDFEEMSRALDRVMLIDALAEVEREIEEGRGIPHTTIHKKLLRWADGGE